MSTRVAILGGGPAGLGAAWQLHRQQKAQAVVIERGDDVGGNAGSFVLDGIPVDFGSHRLHPACAPAILNDLRGLLGAELLERPRHGRIRLRGRWLHFPLKPLDLLAHMPWSFGLGVAGDALRKLVAATADPGEAASFASELERGLGATICRDFYFPYARKIWGVEPDELSATQARRRVSAGSLSKMARRVLGLVPGFKTPGAGRFFYPRNGYGQISRALETAARDAGAEVHLRTTVQRVHLGTPHRIEVASDGAVRTLEADCVWSTIPVTVLARAIDPPPPAEVLDACAQIGYRAMVLVYLVVAQPRFSEFDAHYFPERDVALTRLSEPKNYGARTEPADRTVLCAEIPCDVGDAVWRSADAELADRVGGALARCGLPLRGEILRVVSKRLPAAYPIYRRGYDAPLRRLDDWLAGLDRVLTFGRQGLFAHDNTHHTLAMAYGAVDCLDAAGRFDMARWREYRLEVATHVVED